MVVRLYGKALKDYLAKHPDATSPQPAYTRRVYSSRGAVHQRVPSEDELRRNSEQAKLLEEALKKKE